MLNLSGSLRLEQRGRAQARARRARYGGRAPFTVDAMEPAEDAEAFRGPFFTRASLTMFLYFSDSLMCQSGHIIQAHRFPSEQRS